MSFNNTPKPSPEQFELWDPSSLLPRTKDGYAEAVKRLEQSGYFLPELIQAFSLFTDHFDENTLCAPSLFGVRFQGAEGGQPIPPRLTESVRYLVEQGLFFKPPHRLKSGLLVIFMPLHLLYMSHLLPKAGLGSLNMSYLNFEGARYFAGLMVLQELPDPDTHPKVGTVQCVTHVLDGKQSLQIAA